MKSSELDRMFAAKLDTYADFAMTLECRRAVGPLAAGLRSMSLDF